MTLMVTSLLALMSYSFNSSVQIQIATAREEIPAFQAEMAAHSALQFAMKQLSQDTDWAGTEGPVPLSSNTSFSVARQAGLESSEAVLVLSGDHGGANVTLEMTVSLNTVPDILRENAVAILGGAVNLHDTHIQGNVMITDALNVVEDYTPDPADWNNGTWDEGGANSLDGFSFDSVDIDNGQLRKYSEADYGVDGEEVTINSPVHAPAYNMAPYLEPGPNILQYYGITLIKNVTVDETVVVFPDPGQILRVVNANLKGGLVIYVDPEYDLRDGELNTLVMKKTSSIGGGSGGVHPNLALLAPATRLKSPGCDHEPFLNGISYVNSLREFHVATVNGQLIVHNTAVEFAYSNVYYNESMTDDPPPGLSYFEQASGGVSIVGVRETYNEDGIPSL